MPTFVGMTLRGRGPRASSPAGGERAGRWRADPNSRLLIWVAGSSPAMTLLQGWRPPFRHSGEGRKPRQAAGPKRLPIADADLRRHDAAGTWTAGVLARRWRARGRPPSSWRPPFRHSGDGRPQAREQLEPLKTARAPRASGTASPTPPTIPRPPRRPEEQWAQRRQAAPSRRTRTRPDGWLTPT